MIVLDCFLFEIGLLFGLDYFFEFEFDFTYFYNISWFDGMSLVGFDTAPEDVAVVGGGEVRY